MMEIKERFLLVDQSNGETYRFNDAEELVGWFRIEHDYFDRRYFEQSPTLTSVLVRLSVNDPWLSRTFVNGHGEKAPGEDYYVGAFWCQDENNPKKKCIWYQMRTE